MKLKSLSFLVLTVFAFSSYAITIKVNNQSSQGVLVLYSSQQFPPDGMYTTLSGTELLINGIEKRKRLEQQEELLIPSKMSMEVELNVNIGGTLHFFAANRAGI